MLFALERLGVRATLTSDPVVLAEAERIIFPGVGAAAYAVDRLEVLGVTEVLHSFPRPLLGVCLGMQLLFERSAEGDVAGLGLIPGEVTALTPAPDRPSPHMGWNTLTLDRPKDPLVEGLADNEYVYFVHGYGAISGQKPSDTTVATTRYGPTWAAIVRHRNVCGVQFHPERSGKVGARILSNFLATPC